MFLIYLSIVLSIALANNVTSTKKIVVYTQPYGKYINGYIDIIDVANIATLSNFEFIKSIEDDITITQLANNFKISLAVEPYETLNNWGYKHTGFSGLPIIQSNSTLTVGIVDTTVYNKHFDLVKVNKLPTDDINYGDHGTHCMGVIIAEKNNMGIDSLLGVKEYNDRISTKMYSAFTPDGGGDISKIIRAIDRAMTDNVDVMSHSWGTLQKTTALEIAFRESSKIFHVVAAGNSNIDASLTFPAAFSVTMDNVLTVGAHDINNNRASFSNYGSSVDVYAPGVNILSTCYTKEYCIMSGTSMATPHVAAFAGYLKLKHNNYTSTQLKKLMLKYTVSRNGLPVLDTKLSKVFDTCEIAFKEYSYLIDACMQMFSLFV